MNVCKRAGGGEDDEEESLWRKQRNLERCPPRRQTRPPDAARRHLQHRVNCRPLELDSAFFRSVLVTKHERQRL